MDSPLSAESDWAFYNHFAKIAAFSTHTSVLISAASSRHDLFSTYHFTLKIIPSTPPLLYTLPSLTTTQDTAQALVDRILQAGDPNNSLKLDRQLIKFHVKLAPKDHESKVMVHSELGLLVHYLKIIVAVSQGEAAKGEMALPVNYIGMSMLQCGFCRTMFRVLEESVLPPAMTFRLGEAECPLENEGGILVHQKSMKTLYTEIDAQTHVDESKSRPQTTAIQQNDGPVPQAASSPSPPISATEVIQAVMVLPMLIVFEGLCLGWRMLESKSKYFFPSKASDPRLTLEAHRELINSLRKPKARWPIRVPPTSIANPQSTVHVEERMESLFTTKLSELLCEGWEKTEVTFVDQLLYSRDDWKDSEFQL
ncbi:hypothetical protein BDN72DRAFT_919203 [Pluteus cervinus]|uniref:Uncharacterized protein n=1 Tax=Pluteus cervinus TaxID=181527 RepID=A0ACD3AJZ8_9AGAR|nr:hypothetical protein BDN72DRAFT_919203 [Pluteus cervinus]